MGGLNQAPYKGQGIRWVALQMDKCKRHQDINQISSLLQFKVT